MTTPPRAIESLMIPGPAGRLEALLEEPEQAGPRFAALVCHPHPQHGGTMHNKVVYRLARGLRKAGAVVLRFNYRGVNLSQGSYDHGIGETGDARAALDHLRSRYPTLPYALAGFSFGSRIIHNLGCPLPDAQFLMPVGFPTRWRDLPQFKRCPTRRIFIHSTNDEYGPRAELEPWFDSLDHPKRILWIEARDHFFAGALDALEQAVIDSVPDLPPAP